MIKLYSLIDILNTVLLLSLHLSIYNVTCFYTGLRSQKWKLRRLLFVLFTLLISAYAASLFWTDQKVLPFKRKEIFSMISFNMLIQHFQIRSNSFSKWFHRRVCSSKCCLGFLWCLMKFKLPIHLGKLFVAIITVNKNEALMVISSCYT